MEFIFSIKVNKSLINIKKGLKALFDLKILISAIDFCVFRILLNEISSWCDFISHQHGE